MQHSSLHYWCYLFVFYELSQVENRKHPQDSIKTRPGERWRLFAAHDMDVARFSARLPRKLSDRESSPLKYDTPAKKWTNCRETAFLHKAKGFIVG